MTAISLPAAPPSLRFGLAILASLLLHAAVLWPFGFLPPPPVPLPPPLLEAVLLAPVLSSQKPADAPAPAAETGSETTPPPDAVQPAPTIAAKPRTLRGRELNAALAALAKLDFYPREAIERGIEGDVIVLLTLTPQGGVAGAAIVSSSGQRLLDEAALSAVYSLTGLPVTRVQVLLPVKFRLE